MPVPGLAGSCFGVFSKLIEADDDKVRFQLSRESKRKIYSATITAVICVLTIGQAHAGFLFLLLVLPLGAWLGWSAYVIVRRPYARVAQIVCIGIWALAIGLIVAAHYVRHEMTRREADRVAAAIDRQVALQGFCPAHLADLGYKPDDLEEKLGANYAYACHERKPKFSYMATFTVFDTFDYDFVKDRWKYRSWAEKRKFLDTRPPVIADSPTTPSTPAPPPGSRPAPRRTP